MLNENIIRIRKEKGMTQEAMAIKLNVVRQTVSKWENGVAVPDADMLCKIAEALDVSVSVLLGVSEENGECNLTKIANTLAEINEQIAIQNKKKTVSWDSILLITGILGNAILVLLGCIYFKNECYKEYMDDVLVKHYDGLPAFILNNKLLWLVILFSVCTVSGIVSITRKAKRNK